MKEEKELKVTKKVKEHQAKEENLVKEVKKANKKVTILPICIIAIIVLLACTTGYFLYMNYFYNPFVGKWEYSFEYTTENVTVGYNMELKRDKTISLEIKGTDGSDDKYTGTYEVLRDSAILYLEDAQGTKLPEYTLHKENKDELCMFAKACDYKYARSGKKTNSYSDKTEVEPVDYSDEEIATALKAAKVETKYDNKTNNQVVITLFHGATCPHCQEFLEYIKGLDKKMKEKIVLKMYEVWSNEDNSHLMDIVANKLGQQVSGVPFIIIGTEKVYNGFGDSMKKEIEGTINKLYKEKNFKGVVDTLK